MNIQQAFENLGLKLSDTSTEWDEVFSTINAKELPDRQKAIIELKEVYLHPESKQTHDMLNNTPGPFLDNFYALMSKRDGYLHTLREKMAIDFEHAHFHLNTYILPNKLVTTIEYGKNVLDTAQTISDAMSHPEHYVKVPRLPTVSNMLYSGAKAVVGGLWGYLFHSNDTAELAPALQEDAINVDGSSNTMLEQLGGRLNDEMDNEGIDPTNVKEKHAQDKTKKSPLKLPVSEQTLNNIPDQQHQSGPVI